MDTRGDLDTGAPQRLFLLPCTTINLTRINAPKTRSLRILEKLGHSGKSPRRIIYMRRMLDVHCKAANEINTSILIEYRVFPSVGANRYERT